jgi:hypothetical protein
MVGYDDLFSGSWTAPFLMAAGLSGLLKPVAPQNAYHPIGRKSRRAAIE